MQTITSFAGLSLSVFGRSPVSRLRCKPWTPRPKLDGHAKEMNDGGDKDSKGGKDEMRSRYGWPATGQGQQMPQYQQQLGR